MAKSIPAYVLDSFALLAYFQAEPGGLLVRNLLEAVRDQEATLYLSLINAGEIFYIVYRRRGTKQAEDVLQGVRRLPITLTAATEERILAAARLKATHPLSYADAFAVTLAQELDARLVTGDPEFRAVEAMIPIMWLPAK